MVVSSKAFYESHPPLANPGELRDVPLVGFMGKMEPVVWNLWCSAKNHRLKPEPVVAANSYSAVLEFVLKGHGIGLLPNFVTTTHLGTGSLVHILKGWAPKPAPVQIVLPDQKEVPQRVVALAELLTKRLAEYF